jgi:hypothetical protein
MNNLNQFDTINLHKFFASANGLCGCRDCMPLDVDYDLAIGIIENNGSVQLLNDTTTNRVSVSINGITTSVKFKGKQITTNQFGNREILAAETINGQNRVLWREVSTGKLRTWLLDGNWNFVNNNNPLVDPNSTEGLLLQEQFGLTTPPIVNPPTTTTQIIDPVGNVELIRNTNTNRVSVRINGITTSVKYKNRQLIADQFADRELVAAETINGQNRVLWREVSTGKLRTWLLNSSWNFVNNNNPLVDPNSTEGLLLQEQFGLTSTPPPVVNDNNNIVLKSSLDLSKTFLLHSNPTATKTIYLDFDGHFVENTPWENGGDLSLGGFYSSINDTSRAEIQRIWQRVAEDFAPFNVNVTTQDPGTEALRKFGTGDDRWGIRVAFTNNRNLLTGLSITNAGGGGTAYYNSFNWATDDVALVFNRGVYTAAETASHEIGHTLGLTHDGNGTNEYYAGHGTGSTSWASIMGAAWLGNDEVVTQWSKGEYFNSNNSQDDLTTITTGNGFTYNVDDHGNTFSTATNLDGSMPGMFGIIERNDDVDVFKFTTRSGQVSFDIRNAVRAFIDGQAEYLTTQGPNLDIEAKLYDVSGVLLQTINPSTLTSASFTTTLEEGTYYLQIDGVGSGNPLGSSPTGYTDYGSLGQYIINAQFPSATDTPPPQSTPIDPNGQVILLTDANKNVSVNGMDIPLMFKGAQVKTDSFNNWKILAAEKNSSGQNEILWKQISTNKLHTWTVDSNWNYIKSNAIVSPLSTQGWVWRQQFSVNSNGDPITPDLPVATKTVIDPNGSIQLLKETSTDLIFVEINGMDIPLMFKGAQVKSNQFNNWKILAVEKNSAGRNEILWKEISTNKLHTWAVDSNWNYIKSNAIASPSSTQGLVWRQQFSVNANGDPITVSALTTDPITGLAQEGLVALDSPVEAVYNVSTPITGPASFDVPDPFATDNSLTSLIMGTENSLL